MILFVCPKTEAVEDDPKRSNQAMESAERSSFDVT